MSVITFDAEATARAKSHFDAYHSRLQDERQEHVARRDGVAVCLDTSRGTLAEVAPAVMSTVASYGRSHYSVHPDANLSAKGALEVGATMQGSAAGLR